LGFDSLQGQWREFFLLTTASIPVLGATVGAGGSFPENKEAGAWHWVVTSI